MMQENDDLRYAVTPHPRFNVRATLLAEYGANVFIKQVTRGHDQIAIAPGGAVKFGENGADAVIREAQEELGLTISTPQYAGMVEAFWHNADSHFHQLILVYRTELTTQQFHELAHFDVSAHDLAAGTTMTWAPIAEVKQQIRPAALADYLLTDAVQHHIDYH